MKILNPLVLIFIFLINIPCAAQVSSKMTISVGEKSSSIISTEIIDGVTFFSLNEFADVIVLNSVYEDYTGQLTIETGTIKLTFSAGNPFVIKSFKDSVIQQAIQLTQHPIKKNNNLFVPIPETLELLNRFLEAAIIHVSPNRIQIVDRNQLSYTDESAEEQIKTNHITLSIREADEKSIITISSSNRTPVFSNFFRGKNLHLILWDVILTKDSVIDSKSSPFINRIEVIKHSEFTELIFQLSLDDIMAYYEKEESGSEFSIHISKREYSKWYVKDSKNFRCIYRDSHAHLVDHILASAENSLVVISKLFNYKPWEKIIINTYDASDYGYGGTTSIPLNFIRIEIEPLEPGYEIVPYNERFQWLISHELVHIAVNDNASDTERFFRSIFRKVNPEKNRPLTIPFSLVTGSNRYTPRWHQEASAVFLETWLSGGFGRVLGNFDEMYFRSMVSEKKEFPDDICLDGKLSHESFLTETLYYVYGGRFATHLAIRYGNEKLLNWFSTDTSEFYPGYKSKFKAIFNIDFKTAWNNFIHEEINFQNKNIETLRAVPITKTKILGNETYGFITEPYYSPKSGTIIFGYHRTGELATLKAFDINSFNSKKLTTLSAPSAIRVASTAYDDSLGLFFYTTNNNQLYRDIRIYDFKTNRDRLLFEDCRTGHLTISNQLHELWGIQHNSGKAILVRSKYPFEVLETMVVFETGDEVQQLAVNNGGNLLAAVIHRVSGQQSIVISDLTQLDEGGRFQFITLTSSGSPENPAWSADDRYLFWNAYTNGVANIYRYDADSNEIIPVTHSLTGLFKPVFISIDSLIAFEFTTDGVRPVMIANSEAERLPAINYLGQKVLDKNPEVMEWNLPAASQNTDQEFSEQKEFNSLGNLKIQTLIPVISGFQKSKVLGLYANIADPLLKNEIAIEFGISPFKELENKIMYHFKFKYDIRQTYYFAIEHNPPDFYDLFNKRKRGTIGNRFTIGHNDYWLYDNPLKIKQTTEFSYFTDTKFINDNLIEVSEPDFYVFRTEFEYRNLRRTIGSFDFEEGTHFKFHVQGFAAQLEKIELAPGTYFEWDNYTQYIIPHNIFRFKLAAGYHYLNNEILQAQFFFGGFGNREVENEPVRQYEKVFRFPGIPIYSIPTDNFLKIMIANDFPAIRFNSPELLGHYIKNINFSVFSQGLITGLPGADKWINIGAQLNIMFSHWYNLESTLSAGIAKAGWKGGNDHEWFISYKILRD